MLACSCVTLDSGITSVVYASRDRGRTWRETKRADDMKWGSCGDPICTFGHDGTAYYVVLGRPKQPGKALAGMWVYRSSDGGRTWSEPTRLQSFDREYPLSFDREYLVTDGTGGKYAGRVYINGTGFVQALTGSGLSTEINLLTSEDSGRTFPGFARRAVYSPQWILGMGNSVVLSDGTVASLFGVLRDANDPEKGFKDPQPNSSGHPNAWIKIVTSRDGGVSLEPGVTIDDWYLERPRSEGDVVPQLAADQSNSPFRDRLYAVWTDFRTGRLDIRLAYSADNGKTWSKSAVINDDRIALDPSTKGPDAMTPIVAVNNRGVVGVAWYDRRESVDNLGWYERFSASLDGGETWLPSAHVSEKPNTYGRREAWPVQAYAVADTSGQRPLNLRMALDIFFYTGGHTGAMAVDANGVFYPFWFDNRTGVSQIWTAPVTVAGAAVRNGSADLAALDDVTSKVTLVLANTAYDHSTNQITVMSSVKNTSKDTLHAPLKLRIVRLDSDVGVAALIGADDGRSGPGSVLDFSALLHDGVLLPDSSSAAKRLAFRLTDLRPFQQGKEFKFGLIDVDARVFAPASKAVKP